MARPSTCVVLWARSGDSVPCEAEHGAIDSLSEAHDVRIALLASRCVHLPSYGRTDSAGRLTFVN